MSSSAKRIQKELAEISLDPPPNCSAGPKGDNVYEWVGVLAKQRIMLPQELESPNAHINAVQNRHPSRNSHLPPHRGKALSYRTAQTQCTHTQQLIHLQLQEPLPAHSISTCNLLLPAAHLHYLHRHTAR
jgi:hypothetical protein